MWVTHITSLFYSYCIRAPPKCQVACRKKQKRVTAEKPWAEDVGDQYVFVGIDTETKLIPAFAVGKRDARTATRFMADLQGRLRERIQLTTDGFVPYTEAVEGAFGSEVDYAKLVKLYASLSSDEGRYSPAKVSGAIPSVLMGYPNPRKISTSSYVERQNLTMRMQMRRFTRLTNGFSKKLENLKCALALYFAFYNFVRVHRTLRVTPAMAAGVTNRLWDVKDLVGLTN